MSKYTESYYEIAVSRDALRLDLYKARAKIALLEENLSLAMIKIRSLEQEIEQMVDREREESERDWGNP